MVDRFLGDGFLSVFDVELSLSEGGGDIDCSPLSDSWTTDADDFFRRNGCRGMELPIQRD